MLGNIYAIRYTADKNHLGAFLSIKRVLYKIEKSYFFMVRYMWSHDINRKQLMPQ